MKTGITLPGAIIASGMMISTSFGQINSATMFKGTGINPGINGSYYGNNLDATGTYSFAGGRQVYALGHHSVVFGLKSYGHGNYSFAQGYRTTARGAHSLAIGRDVEAVEDHSIIFGAGILSGAGLGTDIVNNVENSFMVGFNSNIPTFFVGESSGLGTTGNVGIATTAPTATLDVNGDVKIDQSLSVGSVSGDGSIFVNAESGTAIVSWARNWNSGVAGDFSGGARGVMASAGTIGPGTQPSETYGLWGTALNGTDISCGVHGDALGGGHYSFGVWGTGMNGWTANYGVYGTGTGPNFYAGYFQGNVYTTGLYMSSDKKLKKDIEALTDVEKLFEIQPKEYTYRTKEFSSMNLEEGRQMGFIAQEIEKVFPNLVRETVQPPLVDEEGKIIEEGTTFKTVNYTGLIPIMTAAIQKQKKTIQKQEEDLLALQERINRLENENNILDGGSNAISEAALFQNRPNPFNESTVITYSLPSAVQKAQIMIFDLNGAHQLTLEVAVSSNGRTVLDANQLTPGMYVYSLIADGSEVSSKRMIITN